MTTARVMLWGTYVGAVTWNTELARGVFEYAPEFRRMGVQLSPLQMPVEIPRHTGPNYDNTYKGLPPVLADSLPDKFGNALIDNWCQRTGRDVRKFNPVDRLLYIGKRGMGALEYEPAIQVQNEHHTATIAVPEMVTLASEILRQHKNFSVTLPDNDSQTIENLLQIGTSAGGARAKAVVAWNPQTNEIKSGQVATKSGFEYWLIKFDGVSDNRDKELADPQGYGRIEYAYYLMAKAAGITMSECRLLEEGGRAHFMTKRFDRTDGGDKLHMQSLCALGLHDFNMPGATGYDQAFKVLAALHPGRFTPMPERQELFRRMVFNVLGMNRDDHSKQIAFLMGRDGQWALSPAYDICYCHNPQGKWTSMHQMSINNKRIDIRRSDLLAVAARQDINRVQAEHIIDQITASVSQWQQFAQQAGVSEAQASNVADNIVKSI